MKHKKLWFVILFAVVFLAIGIGFYSNSAAKDEEAYKYLKTFAKIIELIEENYVDPVDTKKLIQKAIQGMISSLDPHSQFLPPEAFKELQVDTKGKFGGIGIVITKPKGILTVIAPIEGTPAFKAGIKAKDIIAKVNGENTRDMMLWEAVKKMRGQKGTQLVITILRKDVPEPIEFTLTRDVIPIESVKSIAITQEYGYIRITNFQENTSEDLKKSLLKLESGNTALKGLILDLRDNPGGLLSQAIKVSDLFINEGLIVSISGRNDKHTKHFRAHKNKVVREYPIVALVNGGSASASEIVAGALQDHKKALILGTVSFGKGSVQTVEQLRDGYGFKFTIARYYTPDGRSIQAQGIIPDIKVKYRAMNVKEANKDTEDNTIKEKDLLNHLGAEPNKKQNDNKIKNKNEPIEDDANYRYGHLKVKQLMRDNQLVRALELLKSYGIFKNLKG